MSFSYSTAKENFRLGCIVLVFFILVLTGTFEICPTEGTTAVVDRGRMGHRTIHEVRTTQITTRGVVGVITQTTRHIPSQTIVITRKMNARVNRFLETLSSSGFPMMW